MLLYGSIEQNIDELSVYVLARVDPCRVDVLIYSWYWPLLFHSMLHAVRHGVLNMLDGIDDIIVKIQFMIHRSNVSVFLLKIRQDRNPQALPNF